MAGNDPKALMPKQDFTPTESAKATIRAILEDGTADNTKRAYRSDLTGFWKWAGESHGLIEQYPVSVNIVLQFQADHMDKLAVSTIERKIAALSVAHRLQGIPDNENPCRNPQVRTLLSSAKRAASKAGKTPRKMKAATADILEAMLATCRGDSIIDKRDRALLMVGFASGGRRRSELAGFTMADLEDAPGGYVLTLRRSKTDQGGDGRPLPVKGRAAKALKEWIESANITEGPLFRSVNRHGQVGESVSAKAIADVVKKRAKLAGLDPSQFGGHSLRSGFVTESARRGVHPAQARALSGHRTDRIFNGYFELGDVMRNPAGELLGMGI